MTSSLIRDQNIRSSPKQWTLICAIESFILPLIHWLRRSKLRAMSMVSLQNFGSYLATGLAWMTYLNWSSEKEPYRRRSINKIHHNHVIIRHTEMQYVSNSTECPLCCCWRTAGLMSIWWACALSVRCESLQTSEPLYGAYRQVLP